MNINKNVDLGKAFDMLKIALKRSQEIRDNDNSHVGYATAYAELSGTVSGVLAAVEDKDDIPSELFSHPK